MTFFGLKDKLDGADQIVILLVKINQKKGCHVSWADGRWLLWGLISHRRRTMERDSGHHSTVHSSKIVNARLVGLDYCQSNQCRVANPKSRDTIGDQV